MERVAWKAYIPLYVKQIAVEICCMTQEIKSGGCAKLEGWDGRLKRLGDIYKPMVDSTKLMYESEHNIMFKAIILQLNK